MTTHVDEAPAHQSDAYTKVGVDTVRQMRALEGLLAHIRPTSNSRQVLGIGLFANVLDLGGIGLAVAMDGVGTKALVAQMLDKYDTIAIDCIAMNVNDLICVGAKPVAMLDYVAVRVPDEFLLEQIGAGLAEGAQQADIEIPGGEIAQIKDMLKGYNDERAFDLVGCAIGTVATDRIITGKDLADGDVVIGLRSSGIHCNGLSLARRALLEGEFSVNSRPAELGRTIGEELLEPTRIYVKPVMEMLSRRLKIKSLAHITSDGFTNLTRIEAEFGFVIEHLPEPQPVFDLIARLGDVPRSEMFSVFNMGIGLCIVVDPDDAGRVIEVSREHDIEAFELGYARSDPERRVLMEPAKLVSKGSFFESLP